MVKKIKGSGLNYRRDLEKTVSYVEKNKITGNYQKIVFPNSVRIGNPQKRANLEIEGITFSKLGFTGSLTNLIDGSSYLIAGSNIQIVTQSNGSIKISSTGTSLGSLTNPLTVGSGLNYSAGTTFDGSVAKTISALSADATINVSATGIKVLKVPFTLTDGNGISNFSFDGGSNSSVAVEVTTNKGLSVSSNGVEIDPGNIAGATVSSADKVLIGDVDDSDGVKTVTVQSIVDLANAGFSGTTTNALTFGNGISGTSSTFNGGSAVTITANPDGPTISVGASGISVLKVPNALSDGDGINTFNYDGSSTSTISVDVKSNSGLLFSSGEMYIDPNNVLTATIDLSDEVILGDGAGGDPKSNDLQSILTLFQDNLTLTDYDWIDRGHKLTTTSSIAVLGGLPSYLTADKFGPYTNFYVSGSSGIINKNTPDVGVATFGGDLLVSGNLMVLSSSTVYKTAHFEKSVLLSGSISGFTATGSAIFSSGITGSLTKLYDGRSYLNAGKGILISTSSDDQVSVFADNSVVATLTGSTFTGPVHFSGSVSDFTATGSVKFNAGLSGSLTKLVDGRSYLNPGSFIIITTASDGQVTIASTGGGGDNDAQYLVLSATSSLNAERVFTLSTGLSSSDGGAGGNYSVSIDDDIVATVSGSTFSGAVNFNSGLTGSLTKLTSGIPYIIGGGGIVVTTASDGQIHIFGGHGIPGTADPYASYILMSSTASLPNERVLASSTGININDAGAGSSVTFSIDDNIVATLTGSKFSGPAIFEGGLSGSLQALPDGTEYIVGTGSISVLTSSSGQLVISSSGGSAKVTAEQSGGSTVNNVNKFIFTGSLVSDSGGGSITVTPVIGASEEGSYDDGLFTDFSYSTNIGTAIDRFNEVLKGLAPGAAPSLDDAGCDDSGNSAKLSFGNSQSISSYTNARPSTLTPSDNLSDVDINGTFSSTTVSNDVRVACFAGSTTINGTLNADISADSPNYNANSFGNGDQGTLKLYVNDNSTPIHTVNLSSFGSGNSLNGNSSGFNLSAVTPGHFADGSNFETFKHRQGTYTIDPTDQQNGWNYARVVHTIGSSDTTTNYIEWINDPDSNGLSSDNSAMDSLAMSGTKQLSGIKYNTAGTAQYRIRVLNAYRNVYSTSNISFSGTNCSAGSQSFPAIDYGSGENETKILHLTASVTVTGDPILNSSISLNTSVPHPLKSNLSNVGNQSIAGIFLYNLSNTSTTTSETFRAENYRIKSGSYDTQSDVTAGSNTWDSTVDISGGSSGYQDGMIFYNSRLYAPIQGGVSGDFRNTSDGGSITNGPSSNVNYSSLSSGTKTFYRYFTNTSGGSKSNFSLTINGSGTIASQPTSLSTSNLHVLIKLPQTSDPFSTGWMDLALSFATGQTGDGAGCLVGSLDSSLNASNDVTFGTQSVGDGEYIVVKIEASASWTGYISSMSVSWS